MNKKNKKIIVSLLTGYLAILIIFFLSMLYLSKSYVLLEKKYLEDVQVELSNAFNDSLNTEELETRLTSIIQEYPMEILVSENDTVLFATINIPIEDVRNSIQKSVTLLSSQGMYSHNGHDYFVWYNLYHPAAHTYFAYLMKWEFAFIAFATFILLTVSYFIQKSLFKPLVDLDKKIENMGDYNFSEIEDNISEDGINERLREFARNLNENIQHIERQYTNLEQALQIERERLANTIMVSRAFIHDLKSPLHQNMLENELYLKTEKDVATSVQNIIEENIEKNENVILQINEILQVMDQNIYSLEAEREEIDAGVLIKNARNMFRPIMHEKNLYFSLETPDTLPIKINVPTFKLLIHNILSNAFLYATEDTEVLFEAFDEGDKIIFCCTNEADENSLENMKKGESLFNTLDKNDENPYSSGNGLFLIKELTIMLGGTFNIEIIEQQKAQVKIVLEK